MNQSTSFADALEERCHSSRRRLQARDFAESRPRLLRRHSSRARGDPFRAGTASVELHSAKLAVLTGLYAMLESGVTYPTELVKTRQQVAGTPASSALARLSTLEYLMHLQRIGGARELYRGFGFILVGVVPSEILYYVGYTQAKQALLQTRAGRDNPSAVFLVAGAFADVLSAVVSVPFDIVSQRLQLQGMRKLGAAARPMHPMLGHHPTERSIA